MRNLLFRFLGALLFLSTCNLTKLMNREVKAEDVLIYLSFTDNNLVKVGQDGFDARQSVQVKLYAHRAFKFLHFYVQTVWSPQVRSLTLFITRLYLIQDVLLIYLFRILWLLFLNFFFQLGSCLQHLFVQVFFNFKDAFLNRFHYFLPRNCVDQVPRKYFLAVTFAIQSELNLLVHKSLVYTS